MKTHMQLGMPTLIEGPTIEQSVQLCTELGLDFVEINMNLPEYQLDVINASYVCELLRKTGKYITIHLDENINVCDFNTIVANACFDTVLQTIELAKTIGAPIINMHMSAGVRFSLPDRKVHLFEQYVDRYLGELCRFRDACEVAIGNSDVTICIELGGVMRYEYLCKGVKLLQKSRVFGLTYDIWHDFRFGNSDKAYVLENVDRLKHMHIHDSTLTSDHLPFGEGNLDLAEYFALAKKADCRAVLEVKTVEGLKNSAEWINKMRSD